jgi:hypothetical protein
MQLLLLALMREMDAGFRWGCEISAVFDAGGYE